MSNNINFDYMENNNEIKKIDSSMVECPFCKNVIEAPSKPDVIFKCPKCNKELITYDKRKKSQPKAVVAENPKKTKQKKQIFICICIAIFIALFSYFSHTDGADMQAIYTVTKEYDAAINVEVEKALVKASVDGDKMKVLEIIGNKQTIHFYKGDQVKIVGDVVRGFPDCYRVERLSDGASALMPKKHLVKE